MLYKEKKRIKKRKDKKLKGSISLFMIRSFIINFDCSSLKTPITRLNFFELYDYYKAVFGTDPTDDWTKFDTLELIKPNQKVYFMGNIEEGLVKIGFTHNLETRLKTIKTYCPFPVEVLRVINGSILTEQKMHNYFALVHKHQEWFKIEGELKSYLVHDVNLKFMKKYKVLK